MPLNSQHRTAVEKEGGRGARGPLEPRHRRCGSACVGLGSALQARSLTSPVLRSVLRLGLIHSEPRSWVPGTKAQLLATLPPCCVNEGPGAPGGASWSLGKRAPQEAGAAATWSLPCVSLPLCPSLKASSCDQSSKCHLPALPSPRPCRTPPSIPTGLLASKGVGLGLQRAPRAWPPRRFREGSRLACPGLQAGGVTLKGLCAPGLAATRLLGRGDRFLFNAGPAHRPRRGHAATGASCVTTSGPRSRDTRERATHRASGSPSPPRTHSQSSLGPALHRPTSPPHTR